MQSPVSADFFLAYCFWGLLHLVSWIWVLTLRTVSWRGGSTDTFLGDLHFLRSKPLLVWGWRRETKKREGKEREIDREIERELEREKECPGHAHLSSWFNSMKGGHHHHRHHRGCGCQHLFRKVLAKCGCCYARVRGQCHTQMHIHTERLKKFDL